MPNVADLIVFLTAGAVIGAFASSPVRITCPAWYDRRRCRGAERTDLHLGLWSQAVERTCALASASSKVDDHLAHVAIAYFAHSLSDNLVTHGGCMLR